MSLHCRVCFTVFTATLIVCLVAAAARAQRFLPMRSVGDSPVSSPKSAGRESQTYVISPEDVLDIKIFDVPQLSGQYRVSPEGTIDFPLLPVPIQAEGLSPEGLSKAIRAALQTHGLITDPQITVQMIKSRYHSVAILGAVKKPQLYPVFGHTTLLDVLAQAQGLRDDAGNVVVITRGAPMDGCGNVERAGQPGCAGGAMHNGQAQAADPYRSKLESSVSAGTNARTISVDLKRLMETGDPRLNVILYPGDRVLVTRATVIYVVGAVNHPEGFAMNNEHGHLTVLKAVALAEGLKPTAKLDRTVIIRGQTTKPGKSLELPINLKDILAGRALDPRLQPNDILFVPDSTSQQVLRRAAEAAVQTASGVLVWRVPF